MAEPWMALRPYRFALIGAMAANRYMAPRYSADVDLAILAADAQRVEADLASAGWTLRGELVMTDLTGTSWSDPSGQQVDLIHLPGSWGEPALTAAAANVIGQVPTVTLPFLVFMKLLAARAKDTADVEELLVGKSRARIDEVREVVRRYGRPDDIEDLEQIIELAAWRSSPGRGGGRASGRG